MTVREIYSQLHEGEDKGAYMHNLWRFSKDSFAVYLYVCKSFRSSEVLQIARIRKNFTFANMFTWEENCSQIRARQP